MGGYTGGPALPAASKSNNGVGGGLPAVGGIDGFGGFGGSFLSDSVGRGGANVREDVHKASMFLHANGLLPAPAREATEDFHRAVEAGQAKLNQLASGGLQIDGRVKPFGPTEVLAQRAVTSGQMAPPQDAMNATEQVFGTISQWINRLHGDDNPFEGLHPMGGIRG